jgi:hypothetical protein
MLKYSRIGCGQPRQIDDAPMIANGLLPGKFLAHTDWPRSSALGVLRHWNTLRCDSGQCEVQRSAPMNQDDKEKPVPNEQEPGKEGGQGGGNQQNQNKPKPGPRQQGG